MNPHDIFTTYDLELDDGNDNEKNECNKDETKKTEEVKFKKNAYKYSNRGKSNLYESVVIEGSSKFVMYDSPSGKLEIVSSIEEPTRILKPYDEQEIPYESYGFESSEELQEFITKAKNIDLDSLYFQVISFVRRYNDQDNYIIILFSAYILWSYFQDIFPTTPYIMIVGENDTGKSILGITFEALAYRPIKGTSISAANYYRALGTIEPGQCTIVEDEADRIDEDPDKMAILKTGYEWNGRTPRINMNTNTQRQDWYYTYGLKITLSEKSLSSYKAKGLLDRSLIFNTRPGNICGPTIKEILSCNISANPTKKSLFKELVDLRRLLFCYRLVHFADPIQDIDTGLRNRNQELCKPLLQLFQRTDVVNDIIKSLEKFVNDKNQIKSSTIEAAIYPIIVDEIAKHGNEIYLKEIWEAIKRNIDGIEIDPNSYQTVEYGTIYRNKISKILIDKFASNRKRKSEGTVILFAEDKIKRFQTVYDSSVVSIKVTPKSEGSEGNVDKL